MKRNATIELGKKIALKKLRPKLYKFFLYIQQEINDILAIVKKFGLIVISDEVYSGLVYEEPGFISCGAFSEHRERVLIVQSCSKNFGMTGWRVDFVLGPEDVIKRLAILQSQSTTGVSIISQWGAVVALENAEEVNSYVKEFMQKRRDLFVRACLKSSIG